MADPKRGRGALWLGVALALAAPAAFAALFIGMGVLETPWYAVILCAAAFAAVALALILRKSRVRVVALVLVGLELTAVTWMVLLSQLEPYDGLLRVGDPLPDFEARLVSNGELLTPSDLAQGLNVLVFYRGRL